MINLITPPDILYNHTTSILLLHPSEIIKSQLNDVVKNIEQDINIYLHETEDEEEWVLNLHRLCEYTIIDVDNCPTSIRDMIGYFISFENTFWLTKAEKVYYNNISNKRIYNLDWIGGKLETPK
jgi:hypothetical protein